MFLSHKAILACSVIFVLGLTSCKEDSKSNQESYQAVPPVIATADGNIELRQWLAQDQKKLSLSDRMEFSGLQPKALVKSECHKGKQVFNSLKEFSNTVRVTAMEMIDSNLLAYDLEKEPLNCNLELSLFNAAGSRHVFNLGFVQIIEGQQQLVKLFNQTASTSNGQIVRISQGDVDNFWLRFDVGVANASAQIYCQDLNFDKLPVDRSIRLSFFDLTNPKMLPERSKIVWENPIQSCRLVLSKEDRLIAASSRFELEVARPPMLLEVAQLPERLPNDNPHFAEIARSALGQMQNMIYEDLKLTNSSAFTRIVRVPRHSRQVTIQVYAPAPGNPEPNYMEFSFPWLRLQPKELVNATLSQELNDWVIELSPQGSFRLEMRYIPESPLTCNLHPVKAFKLIAAERFILTDYYPGTETTIKTDYALQAPLFFSDDMAINSFSFESMAKKSGCSWTGPQ